MRLFGKVALISGGSRGMGAAEARLFAKEGAKVVIGDVLDEEGKQIESEINELGGEALFLHLDVCNEVDWQKAVDIIVQRFGKLDVLVNNAGIGGFRRDIEEISGDSWDHIMEVNAKGVFLGTKVVIPEMRKIGQGSIINISSQMGLVGSDSSDPAYHASKGAVSTFTKSAAIRHAKEGIRVNSVHPGPIRTPMTADRLADDNHHQRMLSRIPLGRIGESDDVAYGVLYLASDESSFVTGSELVIDGGWIAQ